MWKRVHQPPRTDLYIPQQTHDGPNVTKLTTERSTFVMPTNGNRQYRIDDHWTTKTKATLNTPWTGSTNFQENTAYKDEYYTIEEEEQQQAIPAKGIKSPEQPTPQERAEHNLTHLPFRSWCPLCVQSKGKADAHKQQKQTSTTPVLQFDFCYFKTLGEIRTTPILTGIDVETGMAMAVVTDNKSGDFTYHVQAIQAFLLECGRVQATLNSTVLQSDQEDHLIALLKATAAKMGGNITVRQKKGTKITAHTCEDPTEAITEHILLEPIVNNTDGLDKQKTIEGMKKEIEQMKSQQVYTEVSYNTLTPEQQKNIIQSRWVLRDKGNTVRARIVAKGYTETISDMDDIYASTPIFCVLRLLLTLSINNGWTIQTGDISVAFLHALAATSDLYMYPPTEFYTPDSGVIWKLNKAIYGLRSSPKAWQETLQQLGLHRSTAEPNVYFTTSRDCYILVYVDDLMFLGVDNTINKIFGAIQQHLMLRSTGTLTPGNTVAFLGRNITNMGDHYEISLADSYTTKLLEETSLSNCKPATTPGTSALKTATAEQEQKLNNEEHSAFRRAVGKLQWMTYTRPDISYATKELARSLQEPTTADQQKLKHLLRYIKGTEHYKQIIRPTIKVPESTVPDLNVYVDSDWAGCHVTRKSTAGFVITMLGATINYGSRTQATIALSSAEAELYAINTGATEALHLKGLCEELTNIKKINIRIHTDSSSGKSMATRIGTSRKAKHIELRHLFIQQLVALDIARIIKIHTNNNPADILTKYVSAETLQRHLNNVGLHIQHQ